jgi:DNA polymerase-3 subunit gamma/tau
MVVQNAIAQPSIKPSAENRSKLFSSSDFISIKTITSNAAKEARGEGNSEDTAVEDIGPTRDFTLSELQEAWMRFADTRLSSNMQVQMAFKVASLEMVDQLKIRVAFPSETQQMYFNDHRNSLAEYLRVEHQISGIVYELDTLKHTEIKLSTMSDKEKFEAMRDRNPALEELRKKFNLQVDF